MIKIMDIQSEIDRQTKYPHVKSQYKQSDHLQIRNNIEHELFYQHHGRYPSSEDESIPEEISDKARDVEEFLSK